MAPIQNSPCPSVLTRADPFLETVITVAESVLVDIIPVWNGIPVKSVSKSTGVGVGKATEKEEDEVLGITETVAGFELCRSAERVCG